MPQIVTSNSPNLLAAQITTQIEFDRTFRTIVKEHAYKGKKVVFIAGLNIDISPQSGQLFPLTKSAPGPLISGTATAIISPLSKKSWYKHCNSRASRIPTRLIWSMPFA